MQAKMKTKKTQKQVVAFALATTLAFMVARVLLSLFKRWHKGCPEIKICVNLTKSEILNLVDCIIAKSKKIHDSVAAVPLDKVAYSNVIKPLAELEAEQSYLVQSCLLPRMVATSKDVREANVEAEKIIDAHNVNCSMREDVYLVKAFAARGEWLDPEAQRYVNCLVRKFESSGTFRLPVNSGETYLLWIVNAALNSEHFFKIAGHEFTVVAIDACYTKPYKTDVLVISAGQTTDVLIMANQFVGRYYMAA